MQTINEIFEKIIYESEEFEKCQSAIDRAMEERVLSRMHMDHADLEKIRNEITGVVLLAEKEAFAIGLRYGMTLMGEVCTDSDNINNL